MYNRMKHESNVTHEDQNIFSPLDEESFSSEESSSESVQTTSFCDCRSRYKDARNVTFPFNNQQNTPDNTMNWRKALNEIKKQISIIKDKITSSEDNGINTEEEKEYGGMNDGNETKIQNQEEFTSINNQRVLAKTNGIAMRCEGILKQLQFPLKKLTTYGNAESLKEQEKKTNLIKVCVAFSDDPELFTKLQFRELTITRNTSGIKEDSGRNKNYFDDGLPKVGSYEEFFKGISVIHYFMNSNAVRDVDDVESYDNFKKGIFQKSHFKLFGMNCSLMISSNLRS